MGLIVKGTVVVGNVKMIRPRISLSGCYQQIRIEKPGQGVYYQYVAMARYVTSKGTRLEQVLRFNKRRPVKENVCRMFYDIIKKMYPEHENHIQR